MRITIGTFPKMATPNCVAALRKHEEQRNKNPAKLCDVQALRGAKLKLESKTRTGLVVKAPQRQFVLQSD